MLYSIRNGEILVETKPAEQLFKFWLQKRGWDKMGSMLSGGGDKTSPLFLCPFSFKTEKHQ
jgi:hypothetical protein